MRQIIDRIFKKNNAEQLSRVVNVLKSLRQNSNYAVLSPIPTGYSWLGVYNGGKSMFPENFVELPSYYSNTPFSADELYKLINEIAALGFAQVLFNGFPPYFETIVRGLKSLQPTIRTGVIYHGFPAEISGNRTVQAAFFSIIKLSKEKKVDKIGFAKKGFGLAFEKLFGVPSYELIYINPEPVKDIKKYTDGKIHVGVLVNNSFRKNFHTQIMAALLIENSMVHVTDAGELGYLDMNERFVAHGHQKHEDFIRILGSMDLNFHVTFSEASGGQVCSESISQGVPCISGYTSSFFDYNTELKKQLIPEGFDDPYLVYLKANEVLKNKETLSVKCMEYSRYLNEVAKERVKEFLNH